MPVFVKRMFPDWLVLILLGKAFGTLLFLS
jgi:hypothetical protein